jgi:hypothetical protein
MAPKKVLLAKKSAPWEQKHVVLWKRVSIFGLSIYTFSKKGREDPLAPLAFRLMVSNGLTFHGTKGTPIPLCPCCLLFSSKKPCNNGGWFIFDTLLSQLFYQSLDVVNLPKTYIEKQSTIDFYSKGASRIKVFLPICLSNFKACFLLVPWNIYST